MSTRKHRKTRKPGNINRRTLIFLAIILVCVLALTLIFVAHPWATGAGIVIFLWLRYEVRKKVHHMTRKARKVRRFLF